jgi:hypothetical protein
MATPAKTDPILLRVFIFFLLFWWARRAQVRDRSTVLGGL